MGSNSNDEVPFSLLFLFSPQQHGCRMRRCQPSPAFRVRVRPWSSASAPASPDDFLLSGSPCLGQRKLPTPTLDLGSRLKSWPRLPILVKSPTSASAFRPWRGEAWKQAFCLAFNDFLSSTFLSPFSQHPSSDLTSFCPSLHECRGTVERKIMGREGGGRPHLGFRRLCPRLLRPWAPALAFPRIDHF